jgi:hypothetical protein
MTTWRVGRKLGRTLYRDDVCIGMVDTPELAAEIVAAMNGASSLRARKDEAMRNIMELARDGNELGHNNYVAIYQAAASVQPSE